MKHFLLVNLFLSFFYLSQANNYFFTSPSGVVQDVSGSSYYQNNLNDLYVIKPTEAECVQLKFTDINLEPGDYINIYDGGNENARLIGQYDVWNWPPIIRSTGNSISIQFVTDDSETSDGWSAEYCSVQKYDYQYTVSSGTFDDGSGTLNYDDDIYKTYLIKPLNAQKVEITFSEFDVEEGYDFLAIYDGTDENSNLIGIYDNSNPPSVITSAGNSLFLRFTSDNCCGNYAGWKLNYRDINGTVYNYSLTFGYNSNGARIFRNSINLNTSSASKSEYSGKQENIFKEDVGDKTVLIYPNPTKGQLTIKIENQDLSKKSAIYVFNPLGKLIMQKSPLTGTDLIDLSSYDNGIYMMRVVVGDKVSDWKIIKE